MGVPKFSKEKSGELERWGLGRHRTGTADSGRAGQQQVRDKKVQRTLGLCLGQLAYVTAVKLKRGRQRDFAEKGTRRPNTRGSALLIQ